MDRVAAVQPLLIGAILLWSSYGKLFAPTAEVTARRTALARLVGQERALPAYRAVGVVHGHLHMPEEIIVDGVPHVDVSLGYPFEQARMPRRAWPLPGLRIP